MSENRNLTTCHSYSKVLSKVLSTYSKIHKIQIKTKIEIISRFSVHFHSTLVSHITSIEDHCSSNLNFHTFFYYDETHWSVFMKLFDLKPNVFDISEQFKERTLNNDWNWKQNLKMNFFFQFQTNFEHCEKDW